MSNKRVLVMGDWVLEENWVLEQRHSPTASRTGQHHWRALGDPDSVMYNFGGAARIARLLWTNEPNQSLDVIGLGWWSDGDTEQLTCLFGQDPGFWHNPFTLSSRAKRNDAQWQAHLQQLKRLRLINLAALVAESAAKLTTTYRVVRLFERITHNNTLELRDRIDFLSGDPSQHAQWDKLKERLDDDGKERFDAILRDTEERLVAEGIYCKEDLAPLQRRLRDRAAINLKHIDAVAIADISNNGMSERLVAKLRELEPALFKVPWFTFVKMWNWNESPSWIQCVREIEHHTILVADDAIRLWWTHDELREGDEPREGDKSSDYVTPLHPNAWFCAKSRDFPAHDAVQWLKMIAKQSNAQRVIALPPGGLVAWDTSDKCDQRVYYQRPHSAIHNSELYIGRGNAVLAGLVRTHLLESESNTGSNLSKIDRARQRLNYALSYGDRFVSQERKHLEEMAGIETHQEHAQDNVSVISPKNQGAWLIDRLQFDVCNEDSLPVWRACPDLPGYAEIVPRRRRQITHLMRLLDGFARRPSSQVSALVIAPPGSGKSYLMHCAAEFLRLQKYEINLSQIQSFSELREEFDRLAAVMSTSSGPHLVFIDEVNARIDGQPAYGAFLTLLQEREVRRRGLTMKLGPVAWVFAGTDLLVDEDMWEYMDRWLSLSPSQNPGDPRVPPTFPPDFLERTKDFNWWTRKKRGLPPTMRPNQENSWSQYAATKAPDFVSRLDRRYVVLNCTEDEELEARNRIFVTGTLISVTHPRVFEVERKLFAAVAGWTRATNRDLQRAVRDARPDDGQLTLAHWPGWAKEQLKPRRDCSGEVAPDASLGGDAVPPKAMPRRFIRLERRAEVHAELERSLATS